MELKLHINIRFSNKGMYQSNLYGIETNIEPLLITLWFVSIEPLWNWNGDKFDLKVNSFSINRTFMELKHVCNMYRCSVISYQSNLYGIETLQ